MPPRPKAMPHLTDRAALLAPEMEPPSWLRAVDRVLTAGLGARLRSAAVGGSAAAGGPAGAASIVVIVARRP